MKPLKYKYETLFRENRSDGCNEYVLQVKKYFYKRPIFVVSVSSFSLQVDFDELSISANDVVTNEERVPGSMSLEQMKQKLFEMFALKFLQQSLCLPDS